jgi:peptidoglycan/LPS O-acetylase OafA/YrhL
LLAIDGLRAFAMLMVFTYHSWQFGDSPALAIGRHGLGFGSLIATFPSGVDLFMVLSGFCLFWPLCKNSTAIGRWAWRDYAVRRIRRIVPPYYAAIVYVTILPYALALLYHLLHRPAKIHPLPPLSHFVTHLLFIHTLFPSTWDKLQGAFWSLGLEAQFYLVFPVVIWGYRRYGIQIAAAMAAASVLYRVIAVALVGDRPWPVYFLFSVFFLGRWMQFAAGMVAAWAVARWRRNRADGSALSGNTMILGAVVLYFLAAASPARLEAPFPIPRHDGSCVLRPGHRDFVRYPHPAQTLL